MRFRIPRSILRAAIAANVFVAASAACHSSIPGNRNNSYQPIGQVDVAQPGGLVTFGRTDKLPNFVLYSPVNTTSKNPDAVINKAELNVETIPQYHRLDGDCEIAQDFADGWMTCPEEIDQSTSVVCAPAIEDQKQIDFIDQQHITAWASSAVDALHRTMDIVREYAVVAPFDSGEAVAEFFALPKTQIERSVKSKDTGNIFVYVIEQIDSPDSGFDSVPNATESESIQTSVVTVNPFQSGVQDLITEIESSIVSRSLGCGYDPYESCFPNEIAESISINELVHVENTRIVSEDEFIPIQFQTLSSSIDAGVGHCAVPADTDVSGESLTADVATQSVAADSVATQSVDIDDALSMDTESVADSIVVDDEIPTESWQPMLEDARSLVESWIEPNWGIRKWEFVTRSREEIAVKKSFEDYRSPKFRWDAVYGSVNSPMLSEIPIDPSLTLAQDLYPQPRWYRSSKQSDSIESIDHASGEHSNEPNQQIDIATIEPKSNSDQLVPMAKEAWGSIGKAIYAPYSEMTRVWQRITFDSKRMVATQMKKIGGLLLRSADSLEGNIGIAKRDAHQSEGNR